MDINRPKFKVEKTLFDKILITLSTLFLVFHLIYIAFVFNKLPNIIPTHFNSSGYPDSYGSKNTLFILIFISIAFYIFFMLISRVPYYYNYLVIITSENAKRQYKNAVTLILSILAEILLLLFYMDYKTVEVALSKSSTMNYMPIFFLIIFLTLIYFIYKMIKLK